MISKEAIEQATKTGALNPWTHPKTGQTRYYVKLKNSGAINVSYYNTGNVSSASLLGNGITNSDAKRLLYDKAWVDEAGEWHWENGSLSSDMKAAIEAYYNEKFSA